MTGDQILADSRASLADLLAEKERLDAMLDEALDKFALHEEELNARFKRAQTPEETAALMAERAGIEDMLGIAALVDRLDVLRELIGGRRG
ncbi:MAG: hypothetical protein ACM33T_01170 [Solirubrobacterales bacterium]